MTDIVPHELVDAEFKRILLSNTAMWLNMLDKDGNLITWNKAAEVISGYSNKEILEADDIWALLYPEEEYRTYIFNKALEVISQEEVLTNFETIIRCKDGSDKNLSWNTHSIKDESGNVIGSIALARDITEIKVNEEKLKALTLELEESNKKLLELSYIDSLTNIPNRRAYNERLIQELEATKRTGKPLSFMMIDIDHFKEYNDKYGHQYGDGALYDVAQTISSLLPRKTDFLARYGGEEIVVILPYTPVENAIVVAEKLHQAVIDLNIKHSYSKHSEKLTISIGIASTDTGIDDLEAHADQALYQAKKNGRNRFELYIK